MTVNHDVVGSSPTAGVLNIQLFGCFFVIVIKWRDKDEENTDFIRFGWHNY